MKPKKLRNKLFLNKNTVSNLSRILPSGVKAQVKGGYSVFPCEISAPQIVCDSVGGYTCYNCGTDTCNCTNTCLCTVYTCPESDDQIQCVSGNYYCN